MSAILPLRGSRLAYPGGGAHGVNPSHPASVGLGGAYIPVGTRLLNLVTGSSATSSVVGTPTAAQTPFGPVVAQSGSPAILSLAGGSATVTAATLASVFSIQTMPTGIQILYFSGINDGTRYLSLIINSSNTLGITINGANTLSSLPVISTNTWYFCVLTFISATQARWTLVELQTGQMWQNTQAIATAMPTWTPSISWQNGSAIPAAWQTAAGMLSFAPLSLTQQAAWAADPWAFWYPPTVDLATMIKGPSQAAYLGYPRRNIIMKRVA